MKVYVNGVVFTDDDAHDDDNYNNNNDEEREEGVMQNWTMQKNRKAKNKQRK